MGIGAAGEGASAAVAGEGAAAAVAAPGWSASLEDALQLLLGHARACGVLQRMVADLRHIMTSAAAAARGATVGGPRPIVPRTEVAFSMQPLLLHGAGAACHVCGVAHADLRALRTHLSQQHFPAAAAGSCLVAVAPGGSHASNAEAAPGARDM